jgi:ubiquinone/menaquinone biosynthesis C-methylase UbiE
MSVYDPIARDFDRQRALPDGVPEAIRVAILAVLAAPHPRILDLGAGAGRFGRAFVAAGDDYTAVDLSFGMLRAFANRSGSVSLAQSDGAALPFPDATFDAVLLIQVLSGARDWRALLSDATRVLRPSGALIVGRVVAPDDGIDARMKTRLAEILAGMDVHPYRDKPRETALAWLAQAMPALTVTAATWTTERRPDEFLTRHSQGARFSVLPEPIRQRAMAELAAWASGRFGDACQEQHSFELIIHRFQHGTTP